MNRFIIVDGLPYLYAEGKAYAVRWDAAGFTVGAEAEFKLKSAPAAIYNERSIKAKCAACLDSIGADQEEQEEPEQAEQPVEEPEQVEQPEQEEKPKKPGRKKKATDESGDPE